MTVRELVALGRYPWHGALGRFSCTDTRKVLEAMEQTDVVGFADRAVDSLSGGERQRVWLAMLVAQDSDCLLLDEPIFALDIAHQIEVLALVRRLSEERGIGVVVVLHDINMAGRFCDELIALKGGSAARARSFRRTDARRHAQCDLRHSDGHGCASGRRHANQFCALSTPNECLMPDRSRRLFAAGKVRGMSMLCRLRAAHMGRPPLKGDATIPPKEGANR